MKKRKQNYERFSRENPELIDRHEVAEDAWQKLYPSTARRDALLDQIRAAVPSLTKRQKEILGMLSQGQTMAKIAGELGVTESAIFDIVKIIRKKVCNKMPVLPPAEEIE